MSRGGALGAARALQIRLRDDQERTVVADDHLDLGVFVPRRDDELVGRPGQRLVLGDREIDRT